MGCTFSSRRNGSRRSSSNNNGNNNGVNDGNTAEPLLVFKVVNVDDNGNEKYHGQMEIIGDDMVLRKRGKPPSMVWPLRSVQWYGYEDFIFCFETGRSAAACEGIFAFRSKQARGIYLTVKDKFQKLNCTVTDMSSEARKLSYRSYRRVVEKVDKEESAPVVPPPRKPSTAINMAARKLPPLPKAALPVPPPLPKAALPVPPPLPVSPPPNTASTDHDVPKLKPRKKPYRPLPEEPTGYTEIDFERTKRFNEQLRMSRVNGGVRRTRHDPITSRPQYY